MPIYRLWRASDDTTFDDVDARDNAHAIAMFSQQLDMAFTLEEGPNVAPYMMGRIAKEVGWTKAPDIPVWVKEPRPSN